jgi:hypothetical protein
MITMSRPHGSALMRRVASSPFSRGMPTSHQDDFRQENLRLFDCVEPIVSGSNLVAQQLEHQRQRLGAIVDCRRPRAHAGGCERAPRLMARQRPSVD